MSLMLRSLLRDPYLVALDDWPLAHQPAANRRAAALSPWGEEQLGRQVLGAMQRIQDFAHELDQLALDSNLASRLATGAAGDLVMKRAGDGSFQLALDVADYKPENIKISLVDDNLVVEAKAESSGENSYSKREFKRWFKVPEHCKVEEIKSSLTRDNKLLINMPSARPAKEEPKVRSIPISVDSHEQPAEAGKQAGDACKAQAKPADQPAK